MSLTGTYRPSPVTHVREQVAAYVRSGGREANTADGLPIIVLTTRGARTGHLRKTPLNRVGHGGKFLLVGSSGGAAAHPAWYHNAVANPTVEIQDGSVTHVMVARELRGIERQEWWQRAVDTFPTYDTYQTMTSRLIPILLCERI